MAVLGTVAGCDTPPPRLPAAAKPAPLKPAPPTAARAALSFVPPTAAQRGYHRYRGTLDGRPVELELDVTAALAGVDPTGSVDATCFFTFLDSSKILNTNVCSGISANQPLEMVRWADPEENRFKISLCTDQAIGPLLTGTYALGNRLVPFRVQEDYLDCLRYEVLNERTLGLPEVPGEDSLWSSVERDYLHLLGPDTLRPARARMQCPIPAQREQTRAALAKRITGGVQNNQYLWVRLNKANLFSYTLDEREEWVGSRHYEETTRQVLYDLRTGQELNILGQLRPGGQRRLHQLLIRQAMADTAYARNRDHWRTEGGPLPLPEQGFAVTPEGLVAYYSEHESEENMYNYSQTITWADLRPLLRPNSPLHRL